MKVIPGVKSGYNPLHTETFLRYGMGVWLVTPLGEQAMKTRKSRISVQKFVSTWCRVYRQGGNQDMVAKALRCTAANVSIRAKALRKSGVKLPPLNPGRSFDPGVVKMNKQIMEMVG